MSEQQHEHRHKQDAIRRTITINKPVEVVSAFWRKHGGTEADQVRFVAAPGNRGTEVHLSKAYASPGPVANVIKVFRHDHPDQVLHDELAALKAIIETGDIMLSDAWVVGPNKKHPAQPDAGATSASAHANNSTATSGAQPESRA